MFAPQALWLCFAAETVPAAPAVLLPGVGEFRYELGLWFPLLGSGRTLSPGHDLFITCIIGMCKIVWKTILEALCYTQTAPTCFFCIIPAKPVALSGYLVLGGLVPGSCSRALAQPPVVFALTQPVELCLKQRVSCSSAFGHQSAAFPLSSLQLGPLSLLVMGVVAVHCMGILVKCAHHFCNR